MQYEKLSRIAIEAHDIASSFDAKKLVKLALPIVEKNPRSYSFVVYKGDGNLGVEVRLVCAQTPVCKLTIDFSDTPETVTEFENCFFLKTFGGGKGWVSINILVDKPIVGGIIILESRFLKIN